MSNADASYVDKYGLYNVRPVGADGMPSGNDGMIITAYAKKLGLPVYRPWEMYMQLPRNGFMPKQRTPEKATPYPSRDFYLGMLYLDMMGPSRMEHHGWNFSPAKLPRLNVLKLAKQLLSLRGRHRNTFWKETGYEQVGHVAYMVPFQDRAFYYRHLEKDVPWIYQVIEWIDRRLEAKDASSKLIRWLKYDQMPDSAVFIEYFGVDHPITHAILARMGKALKE